MDNIYEELSLSGSSTIDINVREKDTITELTANIDDMSAEQIGYAFDKIMKAGAVDVYILPALMKKNRQGSILNVLCRLENKDEVVDAIFKHTRTIGVREKLMERYVLKREFYSIDTPLGEVKVKKVYGYGTEREKLEYDDVRRIAESGGMSMAEAEAYIMNVVCRSYPHPV